MEAEMDCHLIPTSQPLANATSSQGCFNLQAVDDIALNKRVQEQPAQDYKLGDLATIIEQMELSKSKHKNGLNLSISTDIRAFSIFGPTVFLYFQFMRRMIILLTLLSLVSLIPIVYNALMGEAYSRNAYGITAALAKTTIGAHIASGRHSATGKILNISVAAFNICILMVFWIYWKKFTLEKSNQIEKDLGLANYGGVIIEIQQGRFQQNQLVLFVSRFGNVQEVQKVVSMKDAFYFAKKLHEAKERNRLLEYFLSQDIGRQEQLMAPILQNRRRIDTLKKLLAEQMKHARTSQQKIIRYFVNFDDHEAQRAILKTFNEYEGCCAKQVPYQILSSKKIKVVRQQCQPEEIYWENQSVGCRQTLAPKILLILFINLFVVGGLILMALLLASTRPVYYQPLLASNSLNFSAITASANQTLVDSWCLAQQRGQVGELCRATFDLYAIRVLISIALGVVQVVCRWLVKRVVFFFRPYLRYRDKVEESKQVTMHLFINYSLISIVVALCLQTNLFSSAMVSIFISCLSRQPYMRDNLATLLQYPDYTSQWYLQYGYQLVINFIIMALLPHCITPIYQLIKRKVQLYKASRQRYEILMKQQLKLTAFDIEDHYASLLFIILMGFIFAGGLPILIPILLITLIIKYFTAKYLFLHFNKPPPITDRTLGNKIPPILLFTITAYLLNSVWAFGVQSIFASQSALFSDRGINADSNAHNPFQALLVFLKRLANTWQPAMVYIIGVIAIIIRKLLLQVYSSYAHQSSKQKHHQASQQEEEERRNRGRPLQANNCELINKSYKMQANKEYLPILRLLSTLNY